MELLVNELSCDHPSSNQVMIEFARFIGLDLFMSVFILCSLIFALIRFAYQHRYIRYQGYGYVVQLF